MIFMVYVYMQRIIFEENSFDDPMRKDYKRRQMR